MGGRVTHVGPAAAGHALKSLNNLLSATSLLITSEAVLAGRRFGLDPQVMVETLDQSTGRSWSTHYKMPEFVLPRDWSSGFTMRLLIKDLRIALELARATGSPIGLGRAVRRAVGARRRDARRRTPTTRRSHVGWKRWSARRRAAARLIV